MAKKSATFIKTINTNAQQMAHTKEVPTKNILLAVNGTQAIQI